MECSLSRCVPDIMNPGQDQPGPIGDRSFVVGRDAIYRPLLEESISEES